ncbi:MAG: DUF402 domain-containing protein [Pseudomonadota bacterium]
MKINLKIRGIYATSLTKFFMGKGLTIVSPSQTIAKRFGNSKWLGSDRSMDVDIKDLETRQGIFLIGHPEHIAYLVDLIRGDIFDAICRQRIRDCSDSTAEIEFPYLSKSSLDDLRHAVVPTVLNHHRMRIISPEYVDLIEKTSLSKNPGKRANVSRNLEKRLIWDAYTAGKELSIEHVKLTGQVLYLSEGEIIEIYPKEKRLILRRAKFKGRSRYDGLNIPKKEGDYAISELREGDWFYKHTYYRHDGQFIGTYYNINTIIELYPDKIRYMDLEIDVVKWPDGRVEVIDERELNRQWDAGYLPEALKRMAENTARDLYNSP